MKGLKALSEKSKKACVGETIPIGAWIPVYYDIHKDTVYDKPGVGRFQLTSLIRYNTPEEIKQAVEKYMSL